MESMNIDRFLATFPVGVSLHVAELCEALRTIGAGDWTTAWNEADDSKVIAYLSPYCYRKGDDAAEADALRRTLADLHRQTEYVRSALQHLKVLNEKHREVLREPQRNLSILFDDISRLVCL